MNIYLLLAVAYVTKLVKVCWKSCWHNVSTHFLFILLFENRKQARKKLASDL